MSLSKRIKEIFRRLNFYNEMSVAGKDKVVLHFGNGNSTELMIGHENIDRQLWNTEREIFEATQANIITDIDYEELK